LSIPGDKILIVIGYPTHLLLKKGIRLKASRPNYQGAQEAH
jgi:hypothetical protein